MAVSISVVVFCRRASASCCLYIVSKMFAFSSILAVSLVIGLVPLFLSLLALLALRGAWICYSGDGLSLIFFLSELLSEYLFPFSLWLTLY